MSNPIRRFSKYTVDTVEELKKCSWPQKRELVESTIVVTVACLILALFVAAVDLAFGSVIQWLI
ncbi:MAG: preprotein translocase subunit SecE [Lentisphaeraceae bacterium]|nr:preprotein translocase subunit SecE [Lentisphaeraceae bacterium]MCM8538520.1 preprotein translocase subunit SecE [Lentisphaeraceae bacterium]